MRIRAIERFWGILGYLPVLSLFIPWVFQRNSIFVQFHARQGFVLFVLWLLVSLLLFIGLVFVDHLGVVTAVVMFLLFAATALYLLMALMGILKVALGERYRMPVVADVALKLGL